MDKKIVDSFHIEFEKHKVYEKVTWLGVPMFKLPMDLIIMQELIFKVRPDFIVETGTAHGGSALFFASIMRLLGQGKIITVDIDNRCDFEDEKITKILADSADEGTVRFVKTLVDGRVMVFLDSWHSKDHVLRELRLYAPLVALGSYIVVEDTHVNNHPVPWQWGEGPYEAVQEFLKENDNFIVDTRCEKLGVTYNPSGYLQRVK